MARSLESVLANIPGYSGYLAKRQYNDQEDSNEIRQASGLMQIVQAAQNQQRAQMETGRNEKLRAAISALPPDQRTRENVLPLLLEHGNVKELVPLLKTAEKQYQPVGAGGAIDTTTGAVIPPASAPKEAKPPVVRQRYDGENVIQEEQQADGTWREIGRGPRFARSVAPVVNVNPHGDRPKLKQGERYRPDGTVEAVPGSDLYITQSNKHAKDFGGVASVETKTKNAVEKIDWILDDSRKGAFSSNFGGYNAYATQFLPGETQNMRAKIEGLKSDLKGAGLELMRAGGSIGQMTEREWPIVERMIANITPALSESEAREELGRVKAYMEKIVQNARDVYDTEWKPTQFYKAPKQAPGTPTPPPGAFREGQTATGPNGEKIVYRGGKWVPVK